MNRWAVMILIAGCILFAGITCVQGNEKLENMKQPTAVLDDSHMIFRDEAVSYIASIDQENMVNSVVRLNESDEYMKVVACEETEKDFYILEWKKDLEDEFFYQVSKISKDLTDKKEYSVYELPQDETFSSFWAIDNGQLHMLTIDRAGRSAMEYALTFSEGSTQLQLVRLQNLRRKNGILSHVEYVGDELYGVLEDGTCLRLGNEAEEEISAEDCPVFGKAVSFPNITVDGMTLGVRIRVSKENIIKNGVLISLGCLFLVVIIIQYSNWITYHKLQKVSKGMVSGQMLPKKPLFLNRNGDLIWKALSEINKNMSRYNYSKMMSFQAYYRFAPKKIEKMLGKESIADVNIGDMVESFGTIAIVSMEITDTTDRKKLTEWLGARCETIIHQQAKHDGIKVVNNGSLSQMQFMFLDHVADALRFGRETMLELEENGLMKDMEHITILLDTSKFSYGITGVDDEVFPFIIAPQTDVIGKYLERFNELDVRMIMTEDTLLRLGEKVQTRFIGKLHVGIKEIKLYQVLDVYKEFDRQNRIKTDQMFRSALELFYQSDFYLARNTFAEVLKKCPDDLVAKYYMFRCEEALNSNSTEVNFDLF